MRPEANTLPILRELHAQISLNLMAKEQRTIQNIEYVRGDRHLATGWKESINKRVCRKANSK